jgi:predicted ATPase
LRPLNVIIGTNGSGKSNFLEAIALLGNAPNDFAKPIREGGVQDWIWKGTDDSSKVAVASVEAVLQQLSGNQKLCYKLAFYSEQGRFRPSDERIENEGAVEMNLDPFFYCFEDVKRKDRKLEHEDVEMKTIEEIADIEVVEANFTADSTLALNLNI